MKGRILTVFALGIALLSTVACGDKAAPEASAPKVQPPKVQPLKARASEAVTEVGSMEVLDLAGLRAEIKRSGAKLTVVALWATWCAPCIEEMPKLSRFYDAHRAEGLRVVGLCTDDRAELSDQIQKVLDRTEVSYRQALLKPESEAVFFKALGHDWDGALPKTIVFDEAGAEVLYLPAAIDDEVLAQKVAPLLGK